MNWNGWYAVNLRGVSEISDIQFKIKTKAGSKFKVFIQDFKGHKAEIFTNENQTISSTDWTSVKIPLKNLELKNKKFAIDQIKQIYFEGTSKGEVFIDEIKISK